MFARLVAVLLGEVRMDITIGGDVYGSIEGSANHVEMSITAVPEPAQVASLAAGLGLFGLYRRRHLSCAASGHQSQGAPRG